MKQLIIALCFVGIFVNAYKLIRQLSLFLPLTLKVWHIVKYLKKSVMISFVVSEAEKKGLLENGFRIKDGSVLYTAHKDSDGIVWLNDVKLNDLCVKVDDVEYFIDTILDIVKEGVLFEGFFERQIAFIKNVCMATQT